MSTTATLGSGKIRLTHEQQALLEQAPDKTVRWRAFAGCAKTTSCVEYAHQWKQNGLYLAFNAAIASDAKGRFPDNIETKTAHGYAFNALGIRRHSDRLVARLRNDHLEPFKAKLFGAGSLGPLQMRRAFLASFNSYLISADDDFSLHHMTGLPIGMRQYMFDDFASIAEQLMDYPRSDLPFTHDVYLKAFARENRISERYDYIFVDEAQDLNPVLIGMIRKAAMPAIIVGDPKQAIYAFRGAINAMDAFDGPILNLSQSFRFGPATAAAANWVLRQTFSPPDIPVAGWKERSTRILEYSGTLKAPVTVLARTNMRIIRSLISSKCPYHFVGRIEDILRQLLAAHALRFGHDRKAAPWDPLVSTFRTWFDLKDEAENGDDPELPRLVEIIETYREAIPEIVKDLETRHVSNEKSAPLIVSTAHKAKGREWSHVVMLDDFPTVAELEARLQAKKLDPQDFDQELHLLYVSLTRAMDTLSLSGPTYHEIATAIGLTGHH